MSMYVKLSNYIAWQESHRYIARINAASKFVSDCRSCSCVCGFHHHDVTRCRQMFITFLVLQKEVILSDG
jgi:hypothetical protein